MLIAFATLLGCELLGELLRGALHLPIPGPVIGMFVLTIGLTLRPGADVSTGAPVLRPLDRTAGTLLEHMGLLFVPAGVGIIGEISLLRHQWLPILGGVVGSTVLSLGLTAIVMHHLCRAKPSAATLAPSSAHAEAAS